MRLTGPLHLAEFATPKAVPLDGNLVVTLKAAGATVSGDSRQVAPFREPAVHFSWNLMFDTANRHDVSFDLAYEEGDVATTFGSFEHAIDVRQFSLLNARAVAVLGAAAAVIGTAGVVAEIVGVFNE